MNQTAFFTYLGLKYFLDGYFLFGNWIHRITMIVLGWIIAIILLFLSNFQCARRHAVWSVCNRAGFFVPEKWEFQKVFVGGFVGE